MVGKYILLVTSLFGAATLNKEHRLTMKQFIQPLGSSGRKASLPITKFDQRRLNSFICGGSFDSPSSTAASPQFSTYLHNSLTEAVPVHLRKVHVYRLVSAYLIRETIKITQFVIFHNLYIQRKVVLTNKKLTEFKDFCVKGLLWKRGKLARPVTHGGVIALSVLAIVAGSVINSSRVEAVDVTEAVIRANNIAETTIPEGRPRSEVISYQVLGGDTLTSIAQKFNVSSDSIVWTNDLSDPNSIAPGDVLKIPPVSGMVHTVKKGEKLEEIAKKYSANAQAIVDFPFNDISDNFALKEGQTLIVPDGRKPDAPKPAPLRQNNYAAVAQDTNPVRTASGFMWPIQGLITQYASWYHPGALDIQGPYGTPVHASDSGTVIVSQKLGYGYGWHVVVDHGNGYTSLYGHMSQLNVSVGQHVSKGQIVGLEGSTGRSTGPHVHFEVHKNGVPINPISILP